MNQILLRKAGLPRPLAAPAETFMDKAVRILTCAALFTFPLQAVGFTVFGYPITPTIIALALLGPALLLRPISLRPCWKIALIVILWSAGTAIATGNFLSLRSVAIFAILLLPTAIDAPSETGKRAVTWFLRGGVLNLCLVALDFARLRLHLPQLNTLVPLIMPGSIDEMDLRYAGFPRAKALFFEPSYCSMYLAFLVIFLDLLPDGAMTPRKRNVLRLLFIGALLLSRGMAGFVILAAYGAIQLIRYIYARFIRPILIGDRPRVSWRSAAIGVVIVVAAAILWLSVGQSFERSALVPQRLKEIVAAFGDLASPATSASERLGAISITANYLAGASLEQAMAGEGFSSAEQWVALTYAGRGGGWALGRVANMFTAVLLGTGLIGFALYLLYLAALRPSRAAIPGRASFAAVCYFGGLLVAHFAAGILIGYFVWCLLYVYIFVLSTDFAERRPS